MKKKQVIIVAAALAVVLLTGTAVYAIGNLSPESNQVDKPVEQPPLSSAAAEAEETQAPLTAEQVDISAFTVPIGTEAEQILRTTLTKKQMTAQEISNYNSTPDSIKQLTYEEARAKEKEYEAIWNNYQANFADKSWDERNELDPDGERFDALDSYYDYKYYADAIATGIEQAKVICAELTQQADEWIFYAVLEEDWDLIEYEKQFNAGKKALGEFYLVVLEDIATQLDSSDADGNALLQELLLMQEYRASNDFDKISPELMAEYTQRYESGESIESILG